MSNARYNLFPSKPAFRAGLSTSNPDDTANPYTPSGVIRWDQVYVNRDNCYSASTGRFTAPVSGVYCFHFSALLATGYSGINSNWQFRVNANAQQAPMPYVAKYTNEFQWISASIVLDLNSSDYVDINKSSSHQMHINPSNSNEHNGFSGYLVS